MPSPPTHFGKSALGIDPRLRPGSPLPLPRVTVTETRQSMTEPVVRSLSTICFDVAATIPPGCTVQVVVAGAAMGMSKAQPTADAVSRGMACLNGFMAWLPCAPEGRVQHGPVANSEFAGGRWRLGSAP